MVVLVNKNTLVKVDAGELLGFEVAGYEFMHQKGSPGWRNTDTEMFPIIGPTNEVRFSVQTPKGEAPQDQHGLLRELFYHLEEQTKTKAVFSKEYKARTLVKNSKFPQKSTQQWLNWPYDFRFEKSFELKDGILEITFAVSGERDMPFMLGYHPAFGLQSANPEIWCNGKVITLSEILAVGSRALYVPECESIILKDKRELSITTEGFGDFMLWTEVPNMVCIEPITFYPYAVPQGRLHDGFQYVLNHPLYFKVCLTIPAG